MTRILSLDTASTQLRVAYGPDDAPALSVLDEDVHSHGPGLVVRISSLLGEKGAEAVDALVCCRGPGSFTGIRIGLSFAKTFAAMRRVPLYLVDAFELHFALAPQGETPVWALLDARRGELYAKAIREAPSLDAPRVITLQEVLRSASPKSRFIGSGARLHRRELEARFGENCVLEAEPDARILHETAKKCVQACAPEDPVRAEPLYLRASDADLNLAAGRIRSAWSRVFPELPKQEDS